MRRERVKSWGELTLTDIFFAYRKAKADCFFERSISVAEKFVAYEANLPSNLASLHRQLQEGKIAEVLTSGVGDPRVVAKKLNLRRSPSGPQKDASHGYFSDPEREFDRLQKDFKLFPEFRLIGDFSVEAHICSALWINLIGDRLDAALSENAYGSRLRRYRRDQFERGSKRGDYHIEALGSFEPYFDPYKKWRDNGLRAIRSELDDEKAIIAITLDFSSFYHNIDPSFISKSAFWSDIGVTRNRWESSFTKAFADALILWGKYVRQFMRSVGCEPGKTGGLPIGLSIVRILSNVILLKLDQQIENGLVPLYYGRYVDDIFIVLKDTKAITSTEQLWSFLNSRINSLNSVPESPGTLRVALDERYSGFSTLELQAEKQRSFFLEGRSGIDLLENIQSEIRRVSSERRLMPLPEQLDKTASARALSAVSTSADEADTLRRAEGLTIRRLGGQCSSVQPKSLGGICRGRNGPRSD